MSQHELILPGRCNRRTFMQGLTTAATGANALAFVPQSAPAPPERVAADDERLTISKAEYEAAGVKMTGYLARPKGGGRRPAIIVVHENRGLTPHIQEVARRFAVSGFLAFAPDALSPYGGTPSNEAEGPKMLGSVNMADHVAHFAAAVPFLAAHPESTGKVGVVGFCWGGAMVNRLAVAVPSLNAGVAYYGSQAPAEDVSKIKAPLLFHYASLDARINAGIEAYEAALKANNKIFESYMYEGANHAFNNDSNAARYNEAAAALAWQRTLAFFKKYLT